MQFKAASLTSVALRPASLVKLPDPLAEVEYTGDTELDSAAEFNALSSAFAQRGKAEAERRKSVTDSEYWFCMCFQSREQVEEFLQATGWGNRTDKYVDGTKVAAIVGVPLPDGPELKSETKLRVNQRILGLAKEK